jgi:hypothetical protein
VDPFLWAVLDGRVLTRAPLRRLGTFLLTRQERKVAAFMHRLSSQFSAPEDRTYAAAVFRRYPPDPKSLAPTAFGNALRAHEFASRERWGLDVAVVGPRLTLLVPQRALSSQEAARTNVNAYANSMLMSLVVGWAVAIERVTTGRLVEAVLVLAIALLLAVGLHRGAVDAVVDLGVTLSSCVDLYRGSLYQRLGAHLPATAEDERSLAEALNQLLAYGRVLPDTLRRQPRGD